jgi:hypothetical protein
MTLVALPKEDFLILRDTLLDSYHVPVDKDALWEPWAPITIGEGCSLAGYGPGRYVVDNGS